MISQKQFGSRIENKEKKIIKETTGKRIQKSQVERIAYEVMRK